MYWLHYVSLVIRISDIAKHLSPKSFIGLADLDALLEYLVRLYISCEDHLDNLVVEIYIFIFAESILALSILSLSLPCSCQP